MTLDLRWIEDAEIRPRARQLRLLGGFRCSEVAAALGWSWGRTARALRRAGMATVASMRKQRMDQADLERLRG